MWYRLVPTLVLVGYAADSSKFLTKIEGWKNGWMKDQPYTQAWGNPANTQGQQSLPGIPHGLPVIFQPAGNSGQQQPQVPDWTAAQAAAKRVAQQSAADPDSDLLWAKGVRRSSAVSPASWAKGMLDALNGMFGGAHTRV